MDRLNRALLRDTPMYDLESDRVLVTGGTGFIGKRLVETIASRCKSVRVFSRKTISGVSHFSGKVTYVSGDVRSKESVRAACKNVDTIFHLAGYAHSDNLDRRAAGIIHHQISVEGTGHLLEAAVVSGVRRFVFISSVKAMGEKTNGCFDESEVPCPTSPYGLAKLETERLVFETGLIRGMHVTVLRLPLVYGPGMRGNLDRMIQMIASRRFPPLPEFGNNRSMVHVDDSVQALLLAATNRKAIGQVYLVTDGQVYTTRQIYDKICCALGIPVYRWSIPLASLRLGAKLGDIIARFSEHRFFLDSVVLEKLAATSWYCSAKIQRHLGFKPNYTFGSALPKIIAWNREATPK